MESAIAAVVAKVVQLWLYDMEVFAQPWLYYWLLIPASAYLMFFVVKWAVITLPIWLPVSIVVQVMKGR